MKIEPTPVSCIDTPTTALVQLFCSELSDLRFPGIDTTVLQKATEQVTECAREVERLRSALTEAREALETEQKALGKQARQAHAYARIYAAGNDSLSGMLDAIVFDAAKQRVAKKPRARRAKAKSPQLMLENETRDSVASSQAQSH